LDDSVIAPLPIETAIETTLCLLAILMAITELAASKRDLKLPKNR
jgi:hypothetical protein